MSKSYTNLNQSPDSINPQLIKPSPCPRHDFVVSKTCPRHGLAVSDESKLIDSCQTRSKRVWHASSTCLCLTRVRGTYPCFRVYNYTNEYIVQSLLWNPIEFCYSEFQVSIRLLIYTDYILNTHQKGENDIMNTYLIDQQCKFYPAHGW